VIKTRNNLDKLEMYATEIKEKDLEKRYHAAFSNSIITE
jgi:hypothetical protein